MFTVLHYNDADTWNQLLSAADADDVFFSPAYHKANELIIPGQAECFVYSADDLLIMYPYIRRPIGGTPWFDITSAYGYGGFVQHPRQRNATNFHRSFDEYCRSEQIVSEFVRFHPLYENHLYSQDPSLTLVNHQPVVTVEYDSPAFTVQGTVKKEVWKKLNKAQKNDLTVLNDTDGVYTAEFIRLYRATMSLKSAAAFYFFEERFFQSLRELLPEQVVTFIALHRGRVAGGLLVLFGKESAYNFLSCSDPDCERLGTNDLLQFTAIDWAYRRGLRSYLLGGGRNGEDSLFQFKAKFSPCRRQYYIGTRVHERSIYDSLCLRIHSSGTGCGHVSRQIFPAYRR